MNSQRFVELLKVQNGLDELPEGKHIEEMGNEIDCLWIKNEEIKAALKNQDDVIEKMIIRCRNIELKTNEYNPKLLTLEAEEALNKKLIVIMNLMYEQFENNMNKIIPNLTLKFKK